MDKKIKFFFWCDVHRTNIIYTSSPNVASLRVIVSVDVILFERLKHYNNNIVSAVKYIFLKL